MKANFFRPITNFINKHFSRKETIANPQTKKSVNAKSEMQKSVLNQFWLPYTWPKMLTWYTKRKKRHQEIINSRLNRFEINGQTIFAINRKNAERKALIINS